MIGKYDTSYNMLELPKFIDSNNIDNETDYINKYKYLSKTGYEDPRKPETAYFKPTGRYRVKTRGALGTSPAYHAATAASPGAIWSEVKVTWE